MNKMFSTLLAGAALFGAVSANAAEVTTIADKNLYQLQVGTNVLSTAKTKAGTADSLIMIAKPTTSVTSVEYKETLWKLTKVTVPNTTADAYKLTNLATGADLSLDLSKTDAKGGAIIAAGKQTNWFVSTPSGGKVKIYAISDKKNYGLKVADLVIAEKPTVPNKVSLGKEFDGTDFTVVAQETDKVMAADDLNNLYGSSFVFDFEKDLDGNPIDGVAVKASDVEGTEYVNLKLAGDKYLVVDTTWWANNVSSTRYWKMATDAMPEEMKTADKPAAITEGTLLENGRAKELYSFKVQLNVAEGYIITITPANLPKYYATDAKAEGKQTVPSYGIATPGNDIELHWGKFANSKEVMTAPTSATGLEIAKAVFGEVEVPAAIDKDYTYYVKYKNTVKVDGGKTLKNKDLNKFAYTNCESLEAAATNTVAIPAYLWYLDNGIMKNMMNTTVTKGTANITIINEKEAIYAFGTDTIQLTKGPKIDNAKNMGFKTVTKTDIANGALSFRLVSSLSDDLFVVEKEGVLYVTNGTIDDALKLKVVPVEREDALIYKKTVWNFETQKNETVASNDITVPLYTITNRLGNKYLQWIEGGLGFGEDKDFALNIAFMATGKENEYKIVSYNEYRIGEEEGFNYFAITANAGSGILESGDMCADKNVTFEFAQKPAPTYGAPEYGHVKITTREDDGKFIASQTDGFAALKAEGQSLKSSYTSDTLTMWLDTACVENEVKPLYYISTNAFTPEAKDNQRNYLINPTNISDAIIAANKELEEDEQVEDIYPFATVADTYKAAFKAASVCGWDSLAIDGDTINTMALNPAAVAFQVAAELGDEYYRIESNLDRVNTEFDEDEDESESNSKYLPTTMYLAQLNNVLFWTAEQDAAEIFVINRASAPTANEGAIEAATITVLAKEGAVEVLGAAGKKVVVSNILGQVVANTVIASDAATIAVPAGVVVVAVEGEAAVKAIVK